MWKMVWLAAVLALGCGSAGGEFEDQSVGSGGSAGAPSDDGASVGGAGGASVTSEATTATTTVTATVSTATTGGASTTSATSATASSTTAAATSGSAGSETSASSATASSVTAATTGSGTAATTSSTTGDASTTGGGCECDAPQNSPLESIADMVPDIFTGCCDGCHYREVLSRCIVSVECKGDQNFLVMWATCDGESDVCADHGLAADPDLNAGGMLSTCGGTVEDSDECEQLTETEAACE